ncbi:hypothetical protein K438DRAFT_1539197, partial [Mycena galopus ATCC 62051]
QLPRILSRPTFTDISRDAIAAAAPELASVPVEFIRRGLGAKMPEMQAGIAALVPSHLPSSIPRSRLRQALTVPLCGPLHSTPGPLSYPTHALAIAPSSSSGEHDAPHAIFPVHAVVLAVHCAKIPCLPPSSRAPSISAAVTLPVFRLALPSPQAFSILHAFMYTRRLDTALGTLLPMPPAFLESLSASTLQTSESVVAAALANPAVCHTLAAHLYSLSGSNLIVHAVHVKELWQDMVALGMYDVALWSALDLAWEVVLGAMILA